MSTTDPLLAAALYYVERGWPVFLLGRSKRPIANCPACQNPGPDHDRQACECLCCHGFYAATTDPDRVTAMRAAHPQGLLAIRTGAVSDLIVADIDPRNGGAIDPDLMLPTATVATGGGGWHLYYRHPGDGLTIPSRGLHGHPGVDIKADGGYVAAPPSIHPSTRMPYRWVGDRPMSEMPPPLLEACLAVSAAQGPSVIALPAAAPIRVSTPYAGGGGISSPTALLQANLDAIDHAPQGLRRVTLYGSARGTARIVLTGSAPYADAWHALYAAGRRAGQTDRDTRAAIDSGFQAEGLHP